VATVVGQTLAHYRILEKLGAGGMGEVYLAEDTTLKRQVAFKVLPPELAASKERLERFQREAETLAALDHPNIVTIHSVEEAEGVRFLTMQLVEGKRLSELIPPGGMPLNRIFEVAIPLADALAAAHEKGVIHRDLKPGNIMVTKDGRVKVLDFGLAKLRQETAPEMATELPTEPLTEEGRILGTVPYMSPEQLEGKELDARTDIFSLGVILYEMATGERPFKGDTSVSLISSIMRDTPRDADALRRDLPHHLARVVGHCLEKAPRRRYQNALDVRNELEALQREVESGSLTSSGALQVTALPGVRRWKLVAIALAALLVAVIGAVVLRRSMERAPPETLPVEEIDRKMIVVLPFENLGDPADEYFAAGMTEELTSRLAMVSGMGVISRNSAVRYANTEKSLQEIGAELGVDYVLEGTVRWAKEGNSSRVRITPQLIQVRDDTNLWADTYDRVIEDIFAIQSEIAERVVSELGVNLLDTERQSLAVKLTDNPDAYQAYLQGLEIWNQSTGDHKSMRRATKMFERAVELDPTFARAWAWLSRMRAFVHRLGGTAPDLVPGAKAALDRATELAPGDPYVRLARGYYHYHGLRDYDRALQEFEAIAKELPNDAEAIAAIGYIHRRKGRLEESLAALERALALDPGSAGRWADIAQTYRVLRRFDETFSSLDRAIALAPDSAELYELKAMYMIATGTLDAAREVLSQAPVTDPMHLAWSLLEFYDRDFEAALEHAVLVPREEALDRVRADRRRGEALLHLDRTEEAREVLQMAAKELETVIASGSIRYQDVLGWIYALLGRKEDAIREVQRQIELDAIDLYRGPEAEDRLGYVYALFGDTEAAVEILDRLLATPYRNAITVEFLRLDPQLDPMRDEPRFQALLEKHGQKGE
jgi:TolB-like protein/tRNA A-37 threonylcarbamoyl transferase component Bud32/cytochrome c-type biogenesis protein CcmH/NrfG